MKLQKPLITRATIAKLKQISRTVPEEILNPQILSAQRTDVAPLLGERLFNAIVKSHGVEDPNPFQFLMEGGEYTHEGETYENDGLENVIALYAHARYIFFGSNIDTPFGNVQKLNAGNSQPTPDYQKKSIYTENRREAFEIWENVQRYLIRSEYPLFMDSCGEIPASTNAGIKMTLIT